VALYRAKTLSLTLKEEHRLRVFENSVLRIVGPREDEMTGGWRGLHNEELYNLYYLLSIIRMIKSWRIRWARHVACIWSREMHVGSRWESKKERDH
jgi:hypothetical protein